MAFAPGATAGAGALQPYIVQASSADAAAVAVAEAGGTVRARLGLINGVAAALDATALARLHATPGIALHLDGAVRKADDSRETDTRGYLLYPAAATDVTLLQQQTITGPRTTCANRQVTVSPTQQEQQPLQGWGVTVAVVDSGLVNADKPGDWNYQDPATGTLVAEKAGRCFVYRDFLPRSAANGNSGASANNSVDQNGHGTHVISTITDNRTTRLAANEPPAPVGVAPQVNLLVARALDGTGAGSYSDVIAAIDWIVSNKTTYNVRVLNLSLYAPVQGPYWADPLNQAVMRAWQAGIVVVAAAGNSGPDAGTITAPGNVPYVVTVGAVKSGRYTAGGDVELAAYSSRGPTESAFVKPDVVVPASRTIAPMPDNSILAQQVVAGRIEQRAAPVYQVTKVKDNINYYQLSGTSMAAAEVSGIAALIVQANPTLTNDQVKYRLVSTARAALDASTGAAAYSVWEQGAGLVNAPQAVFTTTTTAANTGMDIGQDLTSTTHYWGYTTWDPATSTFQLIDPITGGALTTWDGASGVWTGAGRIWAGAGRIWAGAGRIWAGTGRIWAGGTTSWAGSDSLWAGAGRIWAGTAGGASLAGASTAESLVPDP
jgi:subtilisin family serine protease